MLMIRWRGFCATLPCRTCQGGVFQVPLPKTGRGFQGLPGKQRGCNQPDAQGNGRALREAADALVDAGGNATDQESHRRDERGRRVEERISTDKRGASREKIEI